MDIMMVSLMAMPHFDLSSVLWVLKANRRVPLLQRVGHAAGEMKVVSLLPTETPILLPSAGSPPKWGTHCGCGNTSTSGCMYVCTYTYSYTVHQ